MEKIWENIQIFVCYVNENRLLYIPNVEIQGTTKIHVWENNFIILMDFVL